MQGFISPRRDRPCNANPDDHRWTLNHNYLARCGNHIFRSGEVGAIDRYQHFGTNTLYLSIPNIAYEATPRIAWKMSRFGPCYRVPILEACDLEMNPPKQTHWLVDRKRLGECRDRGASAWSLSIMDGPSFQRAHVHLHGSTRPFWWRRCVSRSCRSGCSEQ